MDAYVVDSFTSEPFSGNPAGVVLLDEPAEEGWMRSVAAEFKHSETAFVVTGGGDDAPKPLRWFTPTTEVDLCGHATLAAAHVLGGEQRFTTRSGELSCSTDEHGMIELDFPARRFAPTDGSEVVPALGELPPGAVEHVADDGTDLIVQLSDAALVRGLSPDTDALAHLPVRGVTVTARGDRPGVDIVSRFFAPAAGVPEDPVTGSAHCALAPWWAEQLDRTDLRAEQASPRGGSLRVRLHGQRVKLAGNAVTVLHGSLRA
ncbi:PhzF family phenazine biosynthesis protein [Actinopolyspora mortivallis]|uniref:Oxidoreductase n=1 Tax=Actinopolyspora mortivallis TaxID=33906 RepID=A0A2T0GVE0_ACTMO|nr:PhzF family phenazine biosynthesis isomerase [Actinopolyspora mortivallis]PRW62983.1 oxidoreductase [Actinopolyspora mortivallis]